MKIDSLISPRKQKKCIGHDSVISDLTKARLRGKLHHAFLFSGVRGIGKATCAWQVIRKILCSGDRSLAIDSDHPDLSLIESGGHPDLFVLQAEMGEKISVQDVRLLNSFVSKTPVRGTSKVVLIDSIEDLNHQGMNALLKSLEEPVGEVYFFIVCHEPGKLMATIRSRCQYISFGALSDQEMHLFEGFSTLEDSKKPLVAGRPGILSSFFKDEGLASSWENVIEFFEEILFAQHMPTKSIQKLAEEMKKSSWARYSMSHFIKSAVLITSGKLSNPVSDKLEGLARKRDASSWMKIWDSWQNLEYEVTRLSLSWREAMVVFFRLFRG